MRALPTGNALVKRIAALALVAFTIWAVSFGAQDCRRVLPWLKLDLHFTPQGHLQPAPEWALVAEKVPANAVIATDTWGSLLVSSRATSYTYNDSLDEKARNRGLGAVKYVLVRKTDSQWLVRVKSWPGAHKLGETPSYELWELG